MRLYLAGDAGDAVEVLKPQVNRGGAEPYALWLAVRSLEALDARDEAVGVFNRAALHDVGREMAIPPDTPISVSCSGSQSQSE